MSYSLSWFVYTPICLPPNIWIMAGAYSYAHVFGTWEGYGLLICSCITIPFSMLMTFIISKKCFYKYIQNNLVQKIKIIKALDRAVYDHPKKIMAMVRVMPVAPWNVLNVILSVLSCSYFDYLLGTAIGIIPKLLLNAYIGVNLKDIQLALEGKQPMSKVQIAFMIT